MDWRKLFYDILDVTRSTVFIRMDDKGIILTANKVFDRAAGITGQAEGLSASDFILTENGSPHPLLADPKSAGNRRFPVLFRFRNEVFNCRLLSMGSDYLLVGEAITVSDNTILEQISALNNETIQFSRELREKNIQLKRLNDEKDELIAELKKAMTRIQTLSGLLPICSYCKNIRDDKGYWQKVERYVSAHSEATFSHGICPDCIRKHFPEIADEFLSKKQNDRGANKNTK